jgi:N-acetylmuramoyl-L-alanine amidase
MNAMPSVLIETGFINHPEESHYIASKKARAKLQKVSIMQLLITKKQLTEKPADLLLLKSRNLRNQQKLL